ncbi:MAG TPA: T9SS type A sorting domain-containing protein, partial [Saprospiraceae bacterium]|nr:T9SS type A sorting domain-containing protein [Saprospiraceae bacterium]
RRYRIRVINNCAEKLNYVLFRLPNGIQALEPADGSTYIPQPSGRKYIVRNPNFSPVYSVRFKADSTTVLSAGTFDVFEYKLPQQSAPTYIYTYAKLEDGSYYEAHLNTFNCPELPWPNFGPNPNDRSQPAEGALALQLFPNPTDGLLYLQVSGAVGETVRVQVLNVTGQSVQEMALPTAEGPQPLQLDARLDSGLYHIVVRAKDGTVRTERFVLERG